MPKWPDMIQLLVISCFWLPWTPLIAFHFHPKPPGLRKSWNKGARECSATRSRQSWAQPISWRRLQRYEAKLHALSAENCWVFVIIKKFVVGKIIPRITNSVIFFISVGVSSYSCKAAICQHIIFNNLSQNTHPMHTWNSGDNNLKMISSLKFSKSVFSSNNKKSNNSIILELMRNSGFLMRFCIKFGRWKTWCYLVFQSSCRQSIPEVQRPNMFCK